MASTLRLPTLRALVALVLAWSYFVGATPARAQDAEAAGDGPRLRAGVGASIGPGIVVGRGSNFGLVPEGHLGLQASDAFAVYAVGSLGLFGVNGGDPEPAEEVVTGGLFVAAALMLELTIADCFSVAVGPEAAAASAAVISDLEPPPGEEALGVDDYGTGLVGGRLHVVGYVHLRESPNGARRHAVALGADLRVLHGDGFRRSDQDAWVVLPMLHVGYEWM